MVVLEQSNKNAGRVRSSCARAGAALSTIAAKLRTMVRCGPRCRVEMTTTITRASQPGWRAASACTGAIMTSAPSGYSDTDAQERSPT